MYTAMDKRYLTNLKMKTIFHGCTYDRVPI